MPCKLAFKDTLSFESLAKFSILAGENLKI